MKKKLLSALLTLTMCTGLLPATAFAAEVIPTIEKQTFTYVYANGVPIFIEAGQEDSSLTSIYYMDGEEKVYLDLDPDTEGEQTERELSGCMIYGGSADGSVASTSITMTGGSVQYIYSGCDNSNTVTGDTSVVMTGGIVDYIYNGSDQGAVDGTATIDISGGQIGRISSSGTMKNSIIRMTGGNVLDGVYGESYKDAVTDTIEITVTGGSLSSYVYGKYSASSQATAYGYIDFYPGSSLNNYKLQTDTFDHLLYKPGYWQYAAFGDLSADFTVKSGYPLKVDEGKTLTIPAGMTLTINGTLNVNGSLINQGSIISNGTINGTITNDGGTEHICYSGEVEYSDHSFDRHMVSCKNCPIESKKAFDHTPPDETGKCICGLDIEAKWINSAGEIFYATSVEGCFLGSGTVELLKDVQIDRERITVYSNYTLDLNGHTMDLGDANIFIENSSTELTIEDSSAEKSGRIIGNGTAVNVRLVNGGRIAVTENFIGTLYVETNKPGIFAEGMAAEAEHFISADDKYHITVKDDDLYLMGDFSKAEVTVDDLTYKGEPCDNPYVTVLFGGEALYPGHYTVTWPDDMKNAGEKTVQITHNDTTLFSGTATGTFKINPKELTVVGADAASRPYDGSKTVKITGVTVNGVYGSDSVQVDCTDLTGILDGADAGTYTSVTLPAMTLTGDAAGNYTVKQSEEAVSAKVEITKAQNTRSGEWTNPIANDLTKEYRIDLSGCEPSVGEWGDDKTYSCKITYSPNAEMSAYKDQIQAEIDANGLLTVSVPKVETDAEGTAAVVTVSINSQNYENWTKGILLIASNRETVTLDVFTPEKSYDGEAMAEEDIEVTALLNDAEIPDISGYTYHWKDAEGKDMEQAPVNVGSYQLVVSVKADDANYVGSITVPVTITKGEPDVAMLYSPITSSGKTLKDAELELDGNSTSGTLAWVLPETTAVTANTEYEWKFTPNDSANYKEMTGTIILWEKAASSGGSGGGGSSTSVKADNDQVTIDTSSSSVSEKDMDKVIDKAAENDADEIIIDTNKEKVTLPEGMTEKIAEETDADLVVDTKNGTVTIPNSTLEDLDAEGKVTVEVTKDSVKISDENGELSDIGKIEVTVPYKENSKTGNVAVEVTKADGTKEVIEDVYDGKNSVTFEIDGSATFVIIDDYVPMADIPVAPEQPAENPFKDVSEKDWFYKAVMYVSDNGLMSGVEADHFGPSWNTTRGMITTILWRMEGKPDAGAVPFTDVDADMYYADAIAWAAEKGIVSGYGDTFGPDDNITREQLASILWRYAKYKGYDVSVGENTNILSYEDAFDISEYAIPAMQWACGAGIISSNDDGTLNSAGHAQRAHAAQMLMKFLKNVK